MPTHAVDPMQREEIPGPTAELPKYKCHKVVHALKIGHLVVSPGTGYDMIPEDGRFGSVYLDAAYMEKHNPKPGGYYVVYEDGYKSFSPAEVFEGGYTLMWKRPSTQDREQ